MFESAKINRKDSFDFAKVELFRNKMITAIEGETFFDKNVTKQTRHKLKTLRKLYPNLFKYFGDDPFKVKSNIPNIKDINDLPDCDMNESTLKNVDFRSYYNRLQPLYLNKNGPSYIYSEDKIIDFYSYDSFNNGSCYDIGFVISFSDLGSKTLYLSSEQNRREKIIKTLKEKNIDEEYLDKVQIPNLTRLMADSLDGYYVYWSFTKAEDAVAFRLIHE